GEARMLGDQRRAGSSGQLGTNRTEVPVTESREHGKGAAVSGVRGNPAACHDEPEQNFGRCDGHPLRTKRCPEEALERTQTSRALLGDPCRVAHAEGLEVCLDESVWDRLE